MKLRIAGLVAATLVLLPGAASAQWYERGPRHHHHHDGHHGYGHGYGHRHGYERHYRYGYDRPIHFDRGHHHHHHGY